MLHVFQGTDLEQLARHMLERRESDLPANPLQPEIFVVQNHHMKRWLSLFVAEQQGIAANMQFEFPAERIWAISRIGYPDIPKMLPSDRGPLCWELMELLDSEEHPLLEPLHHYMEADDRERAMVRNWKLSRRIADIFDQYLVYRPDMLLEWEEGTTDRDNPTVSWQAYLWRTLNRRWKSRLGDPPWLHRARLHDHLEKAIGRGEIDTSVLPDRFTVFGISSMPPSVTRLLVRCAEFCDVTFYQLDPQPSGEHVLADSWGSVGREYREILSALAGDSVTHLPEDSVPVAAGRPADRRRGGEGGERMADPGSQMGLFSEPPAEESVSSTLLSTVQQSVRTGREPGSGSGDGSIQIHSCHSALREVQVLHDQILAALDRDPDLTPGDILVMTPDIDTYAPHIHAQFGVQEEGHPKLPYAVAGESAEGIGLHSILELARSRFRATELLDLFDSELFRSAFSLADSDLNRLEQWIAETGIRWGIDGRFRKEMGLPESDSNSWQAGLDRLLAGYTMQPEGTRLFEGIHPAEGIERTDDARLLGTFSRVLNRLFACYEFCKTAHTIPQWRNFLTRQLEFFYSGEERWMRERTRWQSAVDKLGRETAAADFGIPADAAIVQEWLEEEMEKEAAGRTTGGITFGGMVPLRNIPFRMICLLGMNDGDFPRSKPAAEFDLMQAAPRPGDRSRREDDRLLMLESLIAARKVLYLSYIGQSDRKGTAIPPSVVITELVDYLETRCGVRADTLVNSHPLQAHSRHYFNGGGGDNNADGGENGTSGTPMLFSYSGYHRKVAAGFASGDGEYPPFMTDRLPPPEGEAVSVDSLISFYQHPCRMLLQNRFGIYLERMESRIDDRESFSVDRLQEFSMGQELLERYLSGKDVEEYYRLVQADDRLPEGWPGEAAFRTLASAVSEFGDQLRQVLSQDREPKVPVVLEDPHLTGQIGEICGGDQVLYRFGRQRAKDLVEMWIRHLVMLAAAESGQESVPGGLNGITRMYTRDKKGRVECCEMRTAEQPRAILSDLVARYRSGLCGPFPFFPATSHAFAEAVLMKAMPEEDAAGRAVQKWQNDRVPFPLEGDDPYNRQVFLHGSPIGSDEFRQRAIEFWEPLFKVIE